MLRSPIDPNRVSQILLHYFVTGRVGYFKKKKLGYRDRTRSENILTAKYQSNCNLFTIATDVMWRILTSKNYNNSSNESSSARQPSKQEDDDENYVDNDNKDDDNCDPRNKTSCFRQPCKQGSSSEPIERTA